MLTKDTKTLDRKQASRLLGVSVRTIDRYIRGGKLPAYNKSGRILLKKSDIMQYTNGDDVIPVRTSVQRTTLTPPRQSLSPIAHHATTVSVSPKQHDDFYKDLYDEAKKVLTEYHQKLEQANYRIGHLESQINNPASMNVGFTRSIIPMQSPDAVAHELLKKELNDKEKEIQSLKHTISEEQGARTIFAILTYLLLAAIPVLWYLTQS